MNETANNKVGAHVRRMSAGDDINHCDQSRKSPKKGSALNTTVHTPQTGSVHGDSESRWSIALRSCSADERQGHHQIIRGNKPQQTPNTGKSSTMKTSILTDPKAEALNIAVEQKSGMSNTRPRLIAAEPVKNADGSWNIDIQFNAKFAQEFLKLTQQEPTPRNIRAWVMATMETDPIALKKYLMEDEDYEASGYDAEGLASLKG
jgi:hypothetical protein